MGVDVADIRRPIETERTVDGQEARILHRQVRRRRHISERRHDRRQENDLRRAAEDEHHLGIAAARRAGIGMGEAGIEPDITDGDRKPGELDGKVAQQKT